MFGSNNPFGQTSSSPFGSQSPFGQTSNANTNPFAPKPFGSPTASPFGAQTGSSIFGSTSTGVFGQTPSPLSTTPTFGASSSPAFGSSTPAFGASSTPAFGSNPSPFGGSSLFGQKPAFGGFGSTPAQSSPFGSTVQQTQPAFGTNTFGSTSLFGASSQPSFGATSSPAFGSTGTSLFGSSSSPAFGATSTPAFGVASTPAFGTSSTPAFGASSTPAFGSTSTPSFGATTAPAFGAQSTPAFGSTSTPTFGSTAFGSTGTAFGGSSAPAFGAGSSPLFGSSSTPAFGASSTPAFGSSGTPAFGASSTPSFSFGSAPAFGQSTSAFGSSPFGTTSFGAQTSPFGSQTTTPAFGSPGFGQPAFGGQRVGSRVVAYTPTVDTDGATGSQPAGKLESISAMPAYKEKSHEELRWEDYQHGDKGGPNPAGQPAAGVGFSAPAQSSPFGSTGTFGQAPASAFPSTGGGLFGQKAPVFGSSGFGSSSAPAFSSPFGSSSSSPFGSALVSSFSANSTPSLFGSSVTSAFGTPSPFGSSTAGGSTPAFGSGLTFGNTQSAGLFQSSPATGQTPSLFGQPSTGFGQSASTFGSSLFGPQSNTFGGSLFGNSTPSLAASTPGFGQSTPSLSNPFQAAAPTSGGFSFGNFGQPQQAQSGFGVPGAFGQTTFSQFNANQMNTAIQATTFANPFGTLPAMPEMSIGHAGSSSPIQYGISSMPVSEKTAPIRISSLLIPRHLSQRRIRVPVRKFRPKSDGPRVPFFCDEDEVPSNPKADALFIPRENPRALIIRPIDQWPARTTSRRESFRRNTTAPIHENGKVTGEAPGSAPFVSSAEADGNAVERNGHDNDQNGFYSSKGFHENQIEKGMDSSYMTMSGNRAGEAAIVYEHGADIEALMPKLRHPEYYTEPRIQELAAKERAEPGFCRNVRDFVVGRHGFGSIKFEGETDIRRLDLESLIQFNYREVIVYKDDSKKPPVGQGLNKPAEVTLLNVKCIEKKTGRQFTDGPKVENYKELLKRKAAEQGAEFVSYDAAKGEWKFKVKHFSCYGLGREYSDALVTVLEVIGRFGK